MKSYISGFTPERLQEILKHPYYAKKLANVKTKAEQLLQTEPERFRFSDFHLFVTTGNRSKFEKVRGDYFARLMNFALMYAIEKDEKYLEPLADIIWNICDFETWALPAHLKDEYEIDHRRAYLELVSTNVGKLFGEVLCLVGEENLPELVVRRMKHEVRERIIEGYKKYKFWWMDGRSNWSAVCICGVLGSYLYFATEEEIKEAIPSMIKTAESYFESFDDEGCCMEGYAYWSYGFSYFCEFAELLRNYTNGEIDMFKNPKVMSVAKFQENCAINDNQCIRFSDCGEYFRPNAALAHFLKTVYPDVQIPPISAPDNSFSDIRSFVWLNPDFADSTMHPKSKIYHGAQWFIYRSEPYNFVCKAGSNNEPHNHNDVGSFMISKNGKVSFTDPGTGEYTRQYFSEERYTILEPSSRSHSVPVINGNYQQQGLSERSKIYTERENEYAFSMENAYTDETLVSLKRHFVLSENSITLTDTYEFTSAPESLTERFVTLVEPKLENGKIYCGASALVYDSELFDFELNTDTCVRSGAVKETLYMLDFKPKKLECNMEFTFRFE